MCFFSLSFSLVWYGNILLFLHVSGYTGMVSFKVSRLSILSDGVLCQNWVRKELPAEDDYRRASLSRRVPQCPCQDFFFFFDRRFQFIPWWNVRTPTYTTYSFGNRYGRVRPEFFYFSFNRPSRPYFLKIEKK